MWAMVEEFLVGDSGICSDGADAGRSGGDEVNAVEGAAVANLRDHVAAVVGPADGLSATFVRSHSDSAFFDPAWA